MKTLTFDENNINSIDETIDILKFRKRQIEIRTILECDHPVVYVTTRRPWQSSDRYWCPKCGAASAPTGTGTVGFLYYYNIYHYGVVGIVYDRGNYIFSKVKGIERKIPVEVHSSSEFYGGLGYLKPEEVYAIEFPKRFTFEYLEKLFSGSYVYPEILYNRENHKYVYETEYNNRIKSTSEFMEQYYGD